MHLTSREVWTALHGMIFGAGFLLAFAGGFMGLWTMRSEWVTAEGATHCVQRMIVGAWAMAILAWLTVIIGSYVVYPWYRAKPPQGTSGIALQHYPKYLLVSNKETEDWHEFAMEWKEHIGWFAPILATAVAFVVTQYRQRLIHHSKVRQMLLILFTISFFCASAAGLLGALINKAAPTR